jgi:uncharacterized membrane protein YcaP (DUF421 family)
MSSKRYQFKVIDAASASELEARLREAGAERWSAVGYGVLPDGTRSVLLERKQKDDHHDRHAEHHDRREDDRKPPAASSIGRPAE